MSALDNFGHSQYTYSNTGGLYMEKRKYSGRYFMLLGAVALAAWAGYEFVVRMETIWWALKGVWNLCLNVGYPFWQALTFFDSSMFNLTGFLLACVVFALLTLGLRNRPKAGYWLIVLDVALLVAGGPVLHLFGLSILSWMQSLKLLPLLLVLVGCVVNLCDYYIARRRRRERRRRRWQDDEAYENRPRNRDMARQVRHRRYSQAG